MKKKIGDVYVKGNKEWSHAPVIIGQDENGDFIARKEIPKAVSKHMAEIARIGNAKRSKQFYKDMAKARWSRHKKKTEDN